MHSPALWACNTSVPSMTDATTAGSSPAGPFPPTMGDGVGSTPIQTAKGRRPLMATTTTTQDARKIAAEVGGDLDVLMRDGLYYEYSRAADPLSSGAIPRIPYAEFPAALHEQGPTQIAAAGPQPRTGLRRAGEHAQPVRQLRPHPARRVDPARAQRLVTALLCDPREGCHGVRRPEHPLGDRRLLDPAGRRRGGPPGRRGRRVLLGPRRADAPLPGRPGRIADVPADPLPGPPTPRPSWTRPPPTPTRKTAAASASCWPTKPATRR